MFINKVATYFLCSIYFCSYTNMELCHYFCLLMSIMLCFEHCFHINVDITGFIDPKAMAILTISKTYNLHIIIATKKC